MSAPQHTPGPWEVADMVRASVLIGGACVRLPINDDARANARLIAAAPDLLKVLRMARAKIAAELQVMVMSHTGPDGLIDDAAVVLLIEAEQDLVNQIDEAITKATGGQA